MKPLTLASASPRRRALLEEWGYGFTALDPAVDEAALQASSPTRLVELLAEAKAQAARELGAKPVQSDAEGPPGGPTDTEGDQDG